MLKTFRNYFSCTCGLLGMIKTLVAPMNAVLTYFFIVVFVKLGAIQFSYVHKCVILNFHTIARQACKDHCFKIIHWNNFKTPLKKKLESKKSYHHFPLYTIKNAKPIFAKTSWSSVLWIITEVSRGIRSISRKLWISNIILLITWFLIRALEDRISRFNTL